MTAGGRDPELRRATQRDQPAILDLLRRCLGWQAGGADERLFEWKHRQNPFGESPAWVAVDEGTLVGFRTFLRWEFAAEGDGGVAAVRAVDTVTDPAYRGRGLFTRLTLLAVDEMRAEGVDIIFNTPNDQSRPGYLKMGWKIVGRLPVSVRPASPAGLRRLVQARTPAELWSEETAAGIDAAAALEREDVADVVRTAKDPAGATVRSLAYLRWRYGLADLRYRVFSGSHDVSRGFVVGRLRRRGPALELAVCDLFAPDTPGGRLAVTAALRETGADYAIGLGRSRTRGSLPLPRQGPLLTWRPLLDGSQPPTVLGLGDIELF